MKNSLLVSLAALPLALCALNLSDKSDIRFAEAYAFSTNRAALIATLPPESKADRGTPRRRRRPAEQVGRASYHRQPGLGQREFHRPARPSGLPVLRP